MKGQRVKLTEQRVAAATCPPDRDDAYLWDAEVAGLALAREGKTARDPMCWCTVPEPAAGVRHRARPRWGRPGALALGDCAARCPSGKLGEIALRWRPRS